MSTPRRSPRDVARQTNAALREKFEQLKAVGYLPEFEQKLDKIFAATIGLLDAVTRLAENEDRIEAWERVYRDAKELPAGAEKAHASLLSRGDNELPALKQLHARLEDDFGRAVEASIDVAPCMFSSPFIGHFDFWIPTLSQVANPEQLRTLRQTCPHVTWPQQP